MLRVHETHDVSGPSRTRALRSPPCAQTRGSVQPSTEIGMVSPSYNYPPDATTFHPDLDHAGEHAWHTFPGAAVLAHELQHAYQLAGEGWYPQRNRIRAEEGAMRIENLIRYAFHTKVPGWGGLLPRPGRLRATPDISWDDWSPEWIPPYW